MLFLNITSHTNSHDQLFRFGGVAVYGDADASVLDGALQLSHLGGAVDRAGAVAAEEQRL